MNDLTTQLNAGLLSLRAVWGAFLATLLIWGALLVFMPREAQDAGVLPIALAAVGACEIPALFFLRFKLLGPTLGLAAPDDLRVDESAPEEAVAERLPAALAKYFTASVVGFAIAEAVALFGFVSAYMTTELGWYLAHASAAALLMVIQMPRADGVLALLEPAERKRARSMLGR